MRVHGLSAPLRFFLTLSQVVVMCLTLAVVCALWIVDIAFRIISWVASGCCFGANAVPPPPPSAILITGASSGIGKALALAYAKRGAGVTLALTGRNGTALTLVANACTKLGARVRVMQCDVLDREPLAEWIRSVDSETPLDLVIASAGVTEYSAGVAGDLEAGARACIDVNVTGTFNAVFPALGLPGVSGMRSRGHGQVCILSSLASYAQLSFFDGYSASKAAVRLWGEGLRWRLAHEGIGVTVVAPGYVNTPMTTAFKGAVNFGSSKVDVDDAARQIIEGLEADEPLVVFPAVTFLTSWALTLYPPAVRDFLARARIIAEVRYDGDDVTALLRSSRVQAVAPVAPAASSSAEGGAAATKLPV